MSNSSVKAVLCVCECEQVEFMYIRRRWSPILPSSSSTSVFLLWLGCGFDGRYLLASLHMKEDTGGERMCGKVRKEPKNEGLMVSTTIQRNEEDGSEEVGHVTTHWRVHHVTHPRRLRRRSDDHPMRPLPAPPPPSHPRSHSPLAPRHAAPASPLQQSHPLLP